MSARSVPKTAPIPRILTSPGGQVRLQKCTAKYALAICEPFSPGASGSCVPSGQCTDSHKATGFVRIDSKIGLGGFAYVAIMPSGARDCPQVLYTDATYDRSDTAILISATAFYNGVRTATVDNLPYQADDLIYRSGEGIEGLVSRVVSAGVAVQYTGTALNQSGMVYAYRDPRHGNAVLRANSAGTFQPKNVTALTANAETSICNFSRERCVLADYAADPDEMNFLAVVDADSISRRTDLVYNYSGSSASLPLINTLTGVVSAGTYTITTPLVRTYLLSAASSVIMITGQPGQDFHIEYVVHVEYVGPTAAASYTPSDSDPQGSGMVIEAANSMQRRKNQSPDKSNWTLMYDGLVTASRKAIPLLIPMAEKVLLSMLI